MSNEWVNGIGKVLRDKKNEKSFYIKVDKNITLQEGDYIRMEKFSDSLQHKVKMGFITQDEATDQEEKFSWIKYVLHKAPQRAN